MCIKKLPFIDENTATNRLPILVVDDSQDNLDLMEAVLLGEGFETVVAVKSGSEALAYLEQHTDVAVVLLDLMMPGMDGYEACRRITGNPATDHIPVIVVTGGAVLHNVALQNSFAAGAMDFVTKPINEVELLARIQWALSLYRERVMLHHRTEALVESEEKFRATFDHAPAGIAHVDSVGRLLMTNRQLGKMLGYSRAELSRFTFQQLCGLSNGPLHRKRLLQAAGDDVEPLAYDLPLTHRNGTKLWTRIAISPVYDTAGDIKYCIYVVRDVSKQKAAEENMRLAATVFDSSVEAIVVTDARMSILKVNRAFTAMTGYYGTEVIGQHPSLLIPDWHDEELCASIRQELEQSGRWQGEVSYQCKNGESHPAELTVCSVFGEENGIVHYVGISKDITERRETEERLNYLATHDSLTGLPNRMMFDERLNHAVASASRYQYRLAVLFLDLDRFKVINDTLGHDFGDTLIQKVAKRLVERIRRSDTIARWGGDEFTILLERISTAQDAVRTARRIREALSEPFRIDGREVFVSGSIGISLYPKDGEDSQTLLSNADAAMYGAKKVGRNNYQFYTVELNAKALERLMLESDLRRALERNELVLHFQPKVAIADSRITGVEALVRWQHPQRGLLSPMEFIPLAEETGLIGLLGEWVLESACAQMQAWLESGYEAMRIAVNLSSHQFRREKLSHTVRRILRKTGLAPQCLEFEITESLMMDDMDKTISILRELRNLGIEFAVDDFGTGYSSLGYLKRFPIGCLKIDSSFIRHIPANPDDMAIAAAIISMGHSLRLKVVAEGVESPQQLEFLRRQGCDEAQGFLFSKPLPAAEITAVLGPLRHSGSQLAKPGGHWLETGGDTERFL